MKFIFVKSVLFFIFFLAFIPIFHVSAQENDFGDSDRTINEMLQTPSNDEGTSEPNQSENNENQQEEDTEDVMPISDSDQPLRGEQNLFFLTLQLFLALGIVLLATYALLKFINKRSQTFNKLSNIQNIGGVRVGSNRSVQMVRIGKRLFVVGVGENVELLKEIEDPEELEEIIKSDESKESFDQPIAKFTEWLQKKKAGNSPYSNESNFHHLLDREMKEVKQSHKKVHSALEEKDR